MSSRTRALEAALLAASAPSPGEPGNPYRQFALADPDDGDYPLQITAWDEGAAAERERIVRLLREDAARYPDGEAAQFADLVERSAPSPPPPEPTRGRWRCGCELLHGPDQSECPWVVEDLRTDAHRAPWLRAAPSPPDTDERRYTIREPEFTREKADALRREKVLPPARERGTTR